jgi:hypothetical protein
MCGVGLAYSTSLVPIKRVIMNPCSSRHIRSVVASSVAALGVLTSSLAGTYVNDFTSSTPDRMTLNGGFRAAPNETLSYPAIEGGHLAVVYAEAGLNGAVVLDDLDPAKAIESFNMSFKMRIGGGSSEPADGLAVFFGAVDSTANFGEEGPADGQNGVTGLTVSWDIYNNGAGEAPAIDVKVNGVVVAHKAYDIFGITSDAFTDVAIVLTKNGRLTVTYKSQPVFTDLILEGYAPKAGDRFAIGARTGSLYANHWIDDLNIATVQATATAPTIGTGPASITVNERDQASFTVVANGSAPFTYQWLSNNVAIDGATSATYSIASAPVSANGAKYKVTVTNGSGNITSGEATLTVTPDTTKPTVASIGGNESFNAIVIKFSEPITADSLIAPGNYTLSGGLAITSIEAIDDRTVRLNTSAQTAGTQYTVTISGVTDTAATPNTITASTPATFKAFTLSQGFLKFEYWGNIVSPGTANVDELKNDPRYPNSPDMVAFVPAFDSFTIFPDNTHNDYGARFSGFIIPKVSGDYRFFLFSDDAGELALSPTFDPAGLVVIATEPACCRGFAEPAADNTRTSEPIHLEANTPYAIQAIVKEGGGDDYLQIAWRNELDKDTIGASTLTPIPSTFLAAYADPGPATVSFTAQPSSTTAAENTRTTFTAAATGSPTPLVYQWQRKAVGATTFTDIIGATSATYQTPILKQSTDNGAVYRVIARVPGGSVASSEATLTVNIDSTKPQLIAAVGGENQKFVTLTFSEAVDPTSITTAVGGYSIPGLTITSASLKGTDTVVLTTSPQTAGATYTVTVTGVKDSAGNTIDTSANTKTIVGQAIQRGVLKYEAYYGVGGTAVGDLLNYPKYPNSPQLTMLLAAFNSNPGNMNDNNAGENFGVRMSGFVVPSETGEYRFFLNSDDSSALWLSTDDSPANLSATPIASEPGCCTAFSEPGDHPRTSAPIHLEKDRMYYVVFIFKEGTGGDYGRVAWRLETDTTAAGDLQPIPGANLAAAMNPSVLNGFVLSGGTAVGSGTTPGFKARVYQVNQTGINAPVNQVARAEQELAGIIGPNVADLSTSTAGIWSIGDYINWNQEMGTGGNSAEEGSFKSTNDPSRPDQPIPGIPGTGTAAHNTDSIAGEVIGYVEFAAAGVYYLGVNSDDGFAVYGTDKPPVNNGALVVTGPASIAGSYHALLPGSEGSAFPRMSGPVTGKLVYANPPEGCAALTNPDQIRGNIALIDRGVCAFTAKAQAAKDAGAIAVIIVNSRDADSTDGAFPTVMGGALLDFPALMISKPDGAKIKTAVGQDITISITPDTTPILGQFNAGRGATDSIFPVVVPAPGVYPLRTVWFEGGSGANLEIFSVADTGEKILLNDTANPKALKSYQSRSSGPAPTISISRSGANIVITFTGSLYAADKVDGPYLKIAGQGTVNVSATEAAKFYISGP